MVSVGGFSTWRAGEDLQHIVVQDEGSWSLGQQVETDRGVHCNSTQTTPQLQDITWQPKTAPI